MRTNSIKTDGRREGRSSADSRQVQSGRRRVVVLWIGWKGWKQLSIHRLYGKTKGANWFRIATDATMAESGRIFLEDFIVVMVAPRGEGRGKIMVKNMGFYGVSIQRRSERTCWSTVWSDCRRGTPEGYFGIVSVFTPACFSCRRVLRPFCTTKSRWSCWHHVPNGNPNDSQTGKRESFKTALTMQCPSMSKSARTKKVLRHLSISFRWQGRPTGFRLIASTTHTTSKNRTLQKPPSWSETDQAVCDIIQEISGYVLKPNKYGKTLTYDL